MSIEDIIAYKPGEMIWTVEDSKDSIHIQAHIIDCLGCDKRGTFITTTGGFEYRHDDEFYSDRIDLIHDLKIMLGDIEAKHMEDTE